MGSIKVMGFDNQEPDPCEKCSLIKACAAQGLACNAYCHWMTYGQFMAPTGMPSRAYYESTLIVGKAAVGKRSSALAEENRRAGRVKDDRGSARKREKRAMSS